MTTLLIVIAIFGLVTLFVWWLYNSLVTAKARVQESWSQIDVQLKRRADLIPNLVETVKGYMVHERGIFDRLTEARKAMQSAKGAKEAEGANRQLRGILDRLFALAEDNPELKASENFRALQGDLSDTEDKIAYARQFYNTNVMEYNIRIKSFPNVLLAGMFGFGPEDFFEADEAERAKPEVDFGQNDKL